MIKRIFVAAAIMSTLLLGGCSEEERREIRQHQEKIAAEAERQHRLAAQYAAEVAAETQRIANELETETRRIANQLEAETQRLANQLKAETERLYNEDMTAVLQVVSILLVSSGLLAFIVHSIKRLGEFVSRERTTRHEMTLAAISGDRFLTLEQRERLYRNALQSANRGGEPRLGYGGGA